MSSSSNNIRNILFRGCPYLIQTNGMYENNSSLSRPISRGVFINHGFNHIGFGHYPSVGEIVKRARLYDGDNPGETFNNLYLGDTIWASTISAEFSLNDGRRKVVKPLVELLKRGIFDQESREPRSDIEERAMRYSVVCDNHLLNYVVELHQKVGLPRDPCCDHADMSSSGVRSRPSVMPWSWWWIVRLGSWRGWTHMSRIWQVRWR